MVSVLDVGGFRPANANREVMKRMKSVSASIVVLSGSVIFSTGANVAHDQTSFALMIVGAAVGLVGLAAWLFTLAKPDDNAAPSES